MPRRTIETSTAINAPAKAVWAALTDFERLPQWSKFILSVQGEGRTGGKLTVRLDDGGGPMTVRPEVIVFEQEKELRWLGLLGARLLFAGEHYFRLEPLQDGRTRLIHGEHFSGVLVPLLWSKLDGRTRKAFGHFNEALRERAQTESSELTPAGAQR